jgi:chromosomal replication initiator protein
LGCITAHDPQLARLADAIAQRVGHQRFHVWFHSSTRLTLKGDGLEIAVPNDFISEWIDTHFNRSIQEAAHEVLGCPVHLGFHVAPELFVAKDAPAAENAGDESSIDEETVSSGARRRRGRATMDADRTGRALSASAPAAFHPGRADGAMGGVPTVAISGASASVPTANLSLEEIAAAGKTVASVYKNRAINDRPGAGLGNSLTARPSPSGERPALVSPFSNRPRLRHDVESFIVGQSNQLAYNAALYVAEFPGAQYNPLFIHGNCGLGKTHLLQGLCKRFIEHHPTKRWMYLTGEDFTNEFLTCLRANKLDTFRRKIRDLDLLVIDDVHFLGGKKATQEEFLHTFNAIEAMGRQVVMASDNHPKMIEEFGESLINRFVSGMVVRIDPPNFATRVEILRALSQRNKLMLSEEVTAWVARRVTQNVRELEGAINRIAAHVQLDGRPADIAVAQQALGDLDRQLVAPVKPENILQSVCTYFGLEHKDLMSGRRQRTISLARSVAMYLVRKTAKLSFPEIGHRMGKRNHSTVISACRRIERAVQHNESLLWTSAVGERQEEAPELLQRLEEHSRALN